MLIGSLLSVDNPGFWGQVTSQCPYKRKAEGQRHREMGDAGLLTVSTEGGAMSRWDEAPLEARKAPVLPRSLSGRTSPGPRLGLAL